MFGAIKCISARVGTVFQGVVVRSPLSPLLVQVNLLSIAGAAQGVFAAVADQQAAVEGRLAAAKQEFAAPQPELC